MTDCHRKSWLLLYQHDPWKVPPRCRFLCDVLLLEQILGNYCLKMARHMEIVAHLHDAEATDDLFNIVLVPSNTFPVNWMCLNVNNLLLCCLRRPRCLIDWMTLKSIHRGGKNQWQIALVTKVKTEQKVQMWELATKTCWYIVCSWMDKIQDWITRTVTSRSNHIIGSTLKNMLHRCNKCAIPMDLFDH